MALLEEVHYWGADFEVPKPPTIASFLSRAFGGRCEPSASSPTAMPSPTVMDANFPKL